MTSPGTMLPKEEQGTEGDGALIGGGTPVFSGSGLLEEVQEASTDRGA